MKNFKSFFNQLDREFKQQFFILFICYFFILFSYPLVRACTGAIFYEYYTSSEYSFATFVSVIFLIILISIINKLQSSMGPRRVFIGASIISGILLVLANLIISRGFEEFSFVLFALKESYIVILIHMALAYANSSFNLEQAKRLYGPLGAAGSLGGIVGGQLTSYYVKPLGVDAIFYVALAILISIGFLFSLLKPDDIHKHEITFKKSPLGSVRDIRKYVLLMALIVSVSQCVIFISDLQFNMIFEQVITDKTERASFLGAFYSYINITSLVIQFLILPFLLIRVSNRIVFALIPLFLFLLMLTGVGFGSSALWVVGGVFIGMKGIDYSIFSIAKEIMYNPLKTDQKYGAKFIIDMIIYRASKAGIAFIMSIVGVLVSSQYLVLQVIFIFIWVVSIILLLKEQKRLKINL